MEQVQVRTEKLRLRDKCDDYWKWTIHQKGYCEVCGPPEEIPFIEFGKTVKGLNAHHVVTRDNNNLRFDLHNGVLLCVNHHRFGNPCAHGNPIWFMDWFWTNRPADYIYLQDPKWTKTKTWRIADYEDILESLKEGVK